MRAGPRLAGDPRERRLDDGAVLLRRRVGGCASSRSDSIAVVRNARSSFTPSAPRTQLPGSVGLARATRSARCSPSEARASASRIARSQCHASRANSDEHDGGGEHHGRRGKTRDHAGLPRKRNGSAHHSFSASSAIAASAKTSSQVENPFVTSIFPCACAPVGSVARW